MSFHTTRRTFLKEVGYTASSLALFPIFGCGNNTNTSKAENKADTNNARSMDTKELFFKISLAQWSLHRSFNDGKLKADDFATIAKDQFGIDAVEYVNQFYMEQAGNESYFQQLNQRAKDSGVKNLLIMVDDEGELGDADQAKRNQAVQNHFKWVDAAKILECSSIRINAFGEGTAEEVSAALVDGLGQLAEYAEKIGINVLIENHGLYSSNAKWVAQVIQQINMQNCGTLPDFGNFCTAKKWGSTQDNDCEEAYDRYLGVAEMMPYAFGVSAKSYDFDAAGNDTIIDYGRMLEIVKKANYSGYIGIEYEGNNLSEAEGILATKALLERTGLALS